MPQHEAAHRLVDREQDAADRVALLGVVAADRDRAQHAGQQPRPERERVHAREQHAHRRVERDGEDRRDRHREVLRVGERLEEPALLIDQREDRQERDGDHQQREEDRRPDLLQRPQADRVEVALPSALDPFLEALVGVLHLDDGAVDQHADRDGDAGERHDVGGEPHEVERDEREEHRDRDGDDRDDRGRDVPEEEQDDEADDDHLLAQRVQQRVDGAVDQPRAVVGRDDLDARRQRRLELVELRLARAR